MIGVQTVKIIKSDSSAYCMLVCSSGQERHWQRNWRVVWSVDVFAHVWVQSLDTLSNFCDNNNIHSAIWMKVSFSDKYDTSFKFILQFYNKFELLNSQR